MIFLSERPTKDQRGSKPGRLHDWRYSQEVDQGGLHAS